MPDLQRQGLAPEDPEDKAQAVKLKDSKNCHKAHIPGHIPDDAQSVPHKTCRFGYCTIGCCPACGLEMYEWGPVACPHKKNENGALRWYKYPEMQGKHRAAVKEAVMRRKQSRKPGKR